jgi:glyoxylase-like metal-dependent hydrolase (beta-lactamase superfamily II)
MEPGASSANYTAVAEPRAPQTVPSLETFTSDAAGFDTHSFWIDTGREVVVFDAQFTPELAKKLIAEIRSKTKSPIRFVVVTHPNPDKFNGAPAFQAIGAKIVASERTARAIPGVHAYKKHYFVEVAKSFTEATYPAQATIDVTFEGDLALPLEGGAQVRLHELAHRGVSSTQTVAFIPKSNALVVGDLVHHEAHAWLEGGIVDATRGPEPDLASWKLALDELRAFEGATVFGGRGAPAKVTDAVNAQQAYLDRTSDVIRAYLETLDGPTSELAGPNAGTHYARIATLVSEAFPGYAYPYLIEYGAYGLASKIAAEISAGRGR